MQDMIFKDGVQATCLASYNTAPTLWNNPSVPSVSHCDLKPDRNPVQMINKLFSFTFPCFYAIPLFS